MQTPSQSQKPDIRKMVKIFPVLAFVVTLSLYYLFATAKSIFVGKQEQKSDHSAFNTDLPAPSLNEKYKSKLDIYMQAKQDSQKLEKAKQKDMILAPGSLRYSEQFSDEDTSYPIISERKKPAVSMDDNERKVSEKLEKLSKEINSMGPDTGRSPQTKPDVMQPVSSSVDVEQLEKMMASLNSTPEDPEMKRLDGMLDKILKIQNPSAFKATAASHGIERITGSPEIAAAYMQPVPAPDQQGFYGLNTSASDTTSSLQRGFLAVIHDDQTVQDGATVKLRLSQDIWVGGTRIPENSFLYGLCTLGNQRLNIEIKNAVLNNRIIPVRLSVYDIDGIPGVYVPGAISQEVAKNGLNQAIQNLELYSADPSIGAQAATAGIQAAKSLVGKKAKVVNVSLKTGHTVLLYNSQIN